MASALCTNLDEQGLDLLEMMLVYDPAGRISAKQSCNHPYFEGYERPQLPAVPGFAANRAGGHAYGNGYH